MTSVLLARRLVERNWLVFRNIPWVIVSGIFEPVLYLLAIGVGVGELVGDVTFGDQTMSYAQFVAPAMLAAAAMNGALFESTINIFAKLKWQRTYDAVLATPLGPRDIALGELAWSQLRGVAYSTMFLGVMAVFGLVQSWWALAVPAVGLLIGTAFAAWGLASATYMRHWSDFEYVTLAQLPLFLFSATFFPLGTYPDGVQVIVQLTPLYHGVVLCRQLVLGVPDWSSMVHLAYLALMAAAGLTLALRRFTRLLHV